MIYLKRIVNKVRWPLTRRLLGYRTLAYSQEGEDLVLTRLFGEKSSGFYVDVGAHHPQRFSNTYLFYRRGWRGINLDAMPGSMATFRQQRPRDINLEMAVSRDAGQLTYYAFNEPALNTFSEEVARQHEQSPHYRVNSRITLPTFPLAQILDQYLPHGQVIDFLSVDVEGLDLAVLESNDWERYRPTYVLAESLAQKSTICTSSPIRDYMKLVDYALIAHTANTGIFVDVRNSL